MVVPCLDIVASELPKILKIHFISDSIVENRDRGNIDGLFDIGLIAVMNLFNA